MSESNPGTPVRRKSKTYYMTRCAVMAAVLCVLAPLSIPIGPVPISLSTLVIYLSLFILGWKMTSISVLTYLVIGFVGVPVFSGFTGGAAKLLGPTGGYLFGYIPMALLAGWIIGRYKNRGIQLLGLLAGTAVCYAFGTAWYCFVSGSALVPALGACVYPFIPLDLVKIVVSMLLGPVVHRHLVKASVLD